MLPRRAECSHGLEALRSGAGGGFSRWPTGPRAPSRAPSLQGAESCCRTAFPRGTRTAFTRGKRGHRPPGDTDRLPLSPHPGEGELPPNPSRSPPFQPRRLLLFVPGARGSPGARRQRAARPPSGPPVRGQDGPAADRGGRRSKTNKRKITPSPGERSSGKRARSLGKGEPESRGQNGDRPPRRALRQPRRPALPPAGGSPGARG